MEWAVRPLYGTCFSHMSMGFGTSPAKPKLFANTCSVSLCGVGLLGFLVLGLIPPFGEVSQGGTVSSTSSLSATWYLFSASRHISGVLDLLQIMFPKSLGRAITVRTMLFDFTRWWAAAWRSSSSKCWLGLVSI